MGRSKGDLTLGKRKWTPLRVGIILLGEGGLETTKSGLENGGDLDDYTFRSRFWKIKSEQNVRGHETSEKTYYILKKSKNAIIVGKSRKSHVKKPGAIFRKNQNGPFEYKSLEKVGNFKFIKNEKMGMSSPFGSDFNSRAGAGNGSANDSQEKATFKLHRAAPRKNSPKKPGKTWRSTRRKTFKNIL